ncbi:hypothetical protein MMC07_008112 [Pseudocyphellaria aurata]|nr:hypothetical protein [Pseudocyphellaria aurata]
MVSALDWLHAGVLDQLPGRIAVAGLLLVTLAAYAIFSAIIEHLQISRLGGRAPMIRGILPLGIDIAYKSFIFSQQDRDLEFWETLFSALPRGRSRTVELTLASQRFIFTADPENIKAILATQFQDYGKGRPFHEDWKDFLGDSIFTTDGEQWHNSRSLIRPQFIKARVCDLDIFEKHVRRLIVLMGGQGQEVDVAALFYRYTLDASTEFLLGSSVNSLDNPHAEFTKAFAEVQRVQNLIARLGPFQKFIPLSTFRAGIKVIDEVVNPFIDRALLLTPTELEEKTRSTQGYTFLHAVASFTRDRKMIRDQLVAVLLAGRDTTAGTLSFLFQELSNNPEIVKKLRREVFNHVGPIRRPTYDDLKNMSYLQHTINETLRMFPSVSANVRAALHDTTLPRGGGPDGLSPVGIRKDTPIAYSPIYMQRDPQLFPPPSANFPDISTFCPERWDHWIPKSWHYIPFNAGPRICVGQNFALTEMGYTVVRILQRFERLDKYWVDSEQKLKSEIVLSPSNGVKVGFWEAGCQEQ